jgi:hypothetical protein
MKKGKKKKNDTTDFRIIGISSFFMTLHRVKKSLFLPDQMEWKQTLHKIDTRH